MTFIRLDVLQLKDTPGDGDVKFDDILWVNPISYMTRVTDNRRNMLTQVDESRQCLAIDTLSRACCSADEQKSNPLPQALRSFQCATCDGLTSRLPKISVQAGSFDETIYRIFEELIRSSSITESRRPRVAIMMALRRLVNHCRDSSLLNLETSGLGQWCLQSLNSSVRELRIAAGRTLAAFSLDRPNNKQLRDLVHLNRKNTITCLRSISEKSRAGLAETCIMAWGQLGRVVSEDELNLVLIKLLESLGNSNHIVSAFAFNELLNLADARGTSPRRMFEPFWPNLAYVVTKGMVHRPQMSRATAELLQITVTELLLLIQTYALPWLVLDKQKDVIQKIAEARQESEIWRPLMDGANLSATLALLLVQDTEDVVGFAKSRLDELSPHFHPTPIIDLLNSEPVLVAMELLKALGDADDKRKPIVRHALDTVASMILTANKETRNKKGSVAGRFLQTILLGLMARLTDVINDPNPPTQDQQRCIRAMEEMITICKDHARIARPQISACLLSALGQDALREASLSCWAAMITYLEEEDIEALLETTFFVINRYWENLDERNADISKKMLTYLVDHYPELLAKHISKLPSLGHIPELSKIEASLTKMAPSLLVEEFLEVFSQRITHDNSGVVLQALTELVPYLKKNQGMLHASAVSQQPDTVIATLMRSLLDCACRYNGVQADISQLCVECMGLIGCLDSNKIESVREQRSIVVLNNFDANGEITEFTLFLLEEVLVPSFLSATDVKLQGFLSYAMQELLERTEIKAACAMQGTGMLGGNDIYRKWTAIPEASTLR